MWLMIFFPCSCPFCPFTFSVGNSQIHVEPGHGYDSKSHIVGVQ